MTSVGVIGATGAVGVDERDVRAADRRRDGARSDEQRALHRHERAERELIRATNEARATHAKLDRYA